MESTGLINPVRAKQVVIDGKGHLLGRLASTVAKQLLNGQKIVVVRCEALNISGEFFRAKRTSIHYLKRTIFGIQRLFLEEGLAFAIDMIGI